MREQIRSEEQAKAETELKEKFERRQGFTEFAQEICNGDAGLSVKPDAVVELMEQQVDDAAVEALKTVLKSKVVEFKEIGSNGKGKPAAKFTLDEEARADIISGELTFKRLHNAGVLPGQPEDYDLSEFTADQKRF